MTPRRFLNFFRSPTGALTLFLLGLLVVLILVNSRRPSQQRVSLVPAKLFGKKDTAPQVPETVRRDMVPFDPKSANQKPETTARAAAAEAGRHSAIPGFKLIAETPATATKEAKKFSEDFAPFGRLIPCELVITVDSSSIQTPIIGLVTEDIFHHGQLIIPAGTEVHGVRRWIERGNGSRATDAGLLSGRTARN